MKRFSVLMAAAATAALALGAGEQTCSGGGGLFATPCPEGSFCSFNLGECGAAATGLKAPTEGVCKPKPEMCALVVDPVCGCDGVTYNNACAANLKGVSIKSKGECPTKQAGGGLLDNLLPGEEEESTTDGPSAVGTSTTTCGGPGNAIKCAADHVCIYAPENTCGLAGGEGECKSTKDMVCTTDYDPVCGCDGKTYSNACVAQYQNGVAVKSKGECDGSGTSPVVVGAEDPEPVDGGAEEEEPVPVPPAAEEEEQPKAEDGGLFEPRACTIDDDQTTCGFNAYCQVAEGSYPTIKTGACAKKPVICPSPPINTAFTNVCGYDSVTYKTECLAQKAGQNILYRGACFTKDGPPPPNSCGGKNALTIKDCGEGFYCKYHQGVCSLYDSLGECTALPGMCSTDVAPVCGCNGVTYSNACKAGLAGISVKSQGECPVVRIDDGWGGGDLKQGIFAAVAGGMCKPGANLVCPEGYYCAFATGTCGTDKDAEGLCVVQPATCTPDPISSNTVCGCDGHAWATRCDAAMAGVSLKAEVDCTLHLTSGATSGSRASMLVLTIVGMVLAATLALV